MTAMTALLPLYLVDLTGRRGFGVERLASSYRRA
jgi:hypothetical protein